MILFIEFISLLIKNDTTSKEMGVHWSGMWTLSLIFMLKWIFDVWFMILPMLLVKNVYKL